MNYLNYQQKQPSTWKWGILALLFLAPFFFWSYGLANQYAASLENVPSIVFAWEKHIPIWPWTIIPYWSIDLFYGLSLLLCWNRFELKQHTLRLLTAQIISIGCFFLFPLAFSFTRQPMEGFFGLWFDVLMSFDQPFNQAPSLHIVLLVILWNFYRRHSQGLLKIFVDLWSFLIGISVLTTWQHHFIDVSTGLLVGALCLWLFPVSVAAPLQSGVQVTAKHIKLGSFYLIGAIFCTGLAYSLRSWGLWLLYPAFSLLMVALAYLTGRPHWFQKQQNGNFTTASLMIFGPYLLCAWLNSRLWTLKHPEDSLVFTVGSTEIYLGRIPNSQQARKYNALFDCCAELPAQTAKNQTYQQYPHLDLTLITAQQLCSAVQQLEQQIQQLNQQSQKNKLLVFCALGYSRSSALLMAYLLSQGHIQTVEQALELVQKARPWILLRPAQIQQIQCFQQKLRGLAA